MEPIKENDRVRRKKEQAYSCNKGTVQSINEHGKAVVKWDAKAVNGQQQSTLDVRVLQHLTEADEQPAPAPGATRKRKCTFCEGYGHVRVANKLRKCICCNGEGVVTETVKY